LVNCKGIVYVFAPWRIYVKGGAEEDLSAFGIVVFCERRWRSFGRKILLTVIGICGQKKLEFGFICGLTEVLYDIGFGEFSLTLGGCGRFHYRVDIVKEVALRTANGHWPKSLVIGNEAEERDATTCEAIADLGRKLQCTCDTIIGEHLI
jgi:hypothetical protein